MSGSFPTFQVKQQMLLLDVKNTLSVFGVLSPSFGLCGKLKMILTRTRRSLLSGFDLTPNKCMKLTRCSLRSQLAAYAQR